MKTNSSTLLTLCGLLILSLSCNHNVLSCDEDINVWAEAHLAYYSSSKRSQIVELPLGRQIAIYNGLSPENKASLWRSKFELLINSKETSNFEKGVLEEMLLDISPSLFSEKRNDAVLLHKIEQRAKSVFYGDKHRFNAFFCTWMTYDEYTHSAELDRPIMTKYEGEISGDEPKCSCRHDIGCILQGSFCNDKLACKKKPSGCGFLGQYECDGLCD
jgi:hypothetical protein